MFSFFLFLSGLLNIDMHPSNNLGCMQNICKAPFCQSWCKAAPYQINCDWPHNLAWLENSLNGRGARVYVLELI